MKTLFVTAAHGVQVPWEDNPRRYLVEGTSTSVPDTSYYRRRIADGDLKLVEVPPQKPKKEGKEAPNG